MPIKTAIRLRNDMVMVFDERGEQIPEYQGQYRKVKEGILRDTSLDTVFVYVSDCEPELREVPKGEW